MPTDFTDFTSVEISKVVKVGTSLPSTCKAGNLFFNVVAKKVYACFVANSWTELFGSGLQNGLGSTLASATSITPTHKVHKVTGNTLISTIATTNVVIGDVLFLILVEDDAAMDPSGNIYHGIVAGAPNTLVILTYDGTKWAPNGLIPAE